MQHIYKLDDRHSDAAMSGTVPEPGKAKRTPKVKTDADSESKKDDDFLGPVLKEKEAAEKLNVSQKTLQADRAREAPRIPYVKIGRMVRYLGRDIANALRNGYRFGGGEK